MRKRLLALVLIAADVAANEANALELERGYLPAEIGAVRAMLDAARADVARLDSDLVRQRELFA